MKNIDRAFIDDLLSRIDIVELIGQKVELKKHGNSYKGLCPFHAENTPSFNVLKSKQFYHCFGCGVSGDAINFLKEHEGLTFIEAIEKLAKSANIKIPEINDKKYENHKKLIETNKLVAYIFKKNLSVNNKATDYLKSRKILQEQIDYFEIGYAKDEWDNIKSFLQSKGLIKEGLETGLLVQTNNKIYDRFRNRIIFPIKNSVGNIIAFGGRTLDKSENAKYINSPESKVFYKSSELYGLYESKQNINKLDKIIVVEGYTDVIALHKNKFNNSVATLGTAFTKYHISKLLRYSKNIVFCFDGDTAGKTAGWKALNNCLTEIRDKITISFSFINDDKDPDQLCNDEPEVFKKLIDNSLPLSEFMFQQLKIGLDLSKVEDKSKFISLIVPLIQQIPNGVFRTLMEEKLAENTRLSRNELFESYSMQKENIENKKNKLSNNYINDSLIFSIFLEYPTLYEKYGAEIINIIKDEPIKEMLKMFPKLKVNKKYQVSRFLEMGDEYKKLFIEYSLNKVIDKTESNACETLDSILDNIKLKNNEEEYFMILEKYSNGEELSDEEKLILKSFKK